MISSGIARQDSTICHPEQLTLMTMSQPLISGDDMRNARARGGTKLFQAKDDAPRSVTKDPLLAACRGPWGQ